MIYNQHEFDIKFEWGLQGVKQLAPVSDVIIIVDVLSFSTCVDIATGNGARVYPYQWKDASAVDYAQSINAVLADYTRKYADGYSLSPSSLTNIPAGTKLVLPSPNGSSLSLATGHTKTICACLRNAEAVAGYAMSMATNIAVIAAGEQWEDKTLRPAVEDLLGAGAVISYLRGSLSPESKAALSVFLAAENNLLGELLTCSSGKELIERGFKNDVYLAGDFNVSKTVPVLRDGAYVA